MKAYQWNADKLFVGTVNCQPDPAGGWLVPGESTMVSPGVIPSGKVARWDGVEWGYEDAPEPPPPPTRYVRKKLILERLAAEGLKDETLAALNSDAWLHEIWSAATEIDSEDNQVRTMIAGIGADPDEILAPE